MKIFLDLTVVSNEVRDAFEENAARIGIANPFDTAADAISD